ncbi:hypothetical protein KIM372_14130 [Bombiscardovia nodaiensis]|uniref:Addiction module antidote protein n=1 Tax=Bombiscardovia nodaiensis TaxID=2932181 RepID=A0ABM8B9L9_9BIFI|nr:hypothetical protein KIM372_14130 [Bombiscardovia nodaiensis]
MKHTSIHPWSARDYIESEQDAAEYLKAVAELDDPELLEAAAADVAQARKASHTRINR